MSLSKKYATELITRFAEAVRAHEMKGMAPHEQRAEIINNYREARSELAVRFHHTLDQLQDAERRLAEANVLLHQIYRYTQSIGLGSLGESRVQALIDDHQVKTCFMHDVSIAHKMGDPEVHKLLKEKGL